MDLAHFLEEGEGDEELLLILVIAVPEDKRSAHFIFLDRLSIHMKIFYGK